MSRVLKDELHELKQKLMTCFQETLPTKQFSATLSLSIIWLHVIGGREEQNPQERRELTDEFEEGRRIVERGIEMLYEQAGRSPQEATSGTVRNLSRMRRTDSADWTLSHVSGLW